MRKQAHTGKQWGRWFEHLLEGVLVEAKKPGKLSNEDHEVELNMKQRAQSTECTRGICLLQATLLGLLLWRASPTTI
jgi:hypothetical protein